MHFKMGDLATMEANIESLCEEKGLKMTEQRRVIARVLSWAEDHPNVDEVFLRASKIDSNISLATVYRTVRLFEESGILTRLDFGDGKARYEDSSVDHHDHLIDVETGEIIEFQNDQIERLQREVAGQLGYELVEHRLELYARRLKDKS